ncbi:MAG: hypothetical protein UU87_C0001G0072 [Parcubacteria group bacterium GW2011_GWA2_42_11]|nr:MAG: hypothetical protein UU87_C0001G0072 [Parcubacteria group bacterium GW2011_GWA2_42_11]
MTINLKNHHKTYLSAAVFSIGILVTVFFIVLPLISQINKSSKELVEDRLTTETFFANWRNLQTTQQEIEEIKNDLDKRQPLLARDSAVEFIKSLEEIANRTANAQKINVLKEGEQAEGSIDFQIALQGSFPNLMKFLINIENISYCGKIKTINITNAIEPSANRVGDSTVVSNVNSLISLSVLTY